MSKADTQPLIHPLITLDQYRETIMFSNRKKKKNKDQGLNFFVALKRVQFYTLLSTTVTSDDLRGVDNRSHLNAGI